MNTIFDLLYNPGRIGYYTDDSTRPSAAERARREQQFYEQFSPDSKGHKIGRAAVALLVSVIGVGVVTTVALLLHAVHLV